jgi:cutinase
MHGAVAKLPEQVKSKVVGGVLFGDSLNKRSGGSIPSFPKDRLLEVCTSGDGVCGGGGSGISCKLSLDIYSEDRLI